MAKLYDYENVVANAGAGFAKSNRAKARKALIKKKLPDQLVDDFLDEVEQARSVKNAMTDLMMMRSDAMGKTLGADVLFNATNKFTKLVFRNLVQKQLDVKFKDVFLEIHEKSGNLQVWFHAKGGTTQVLLDYKAKSIF